MFEALVTNMYGRSQVIKAGKRDEEDGITKNDKQQQHYQQLFALYGLNLKHEARVFSPEVYYICMEYQFVWVLSVMIIRTNFDFTYHQSFFE